MANEIILNKKANEIVLPNFEENTFNDEIRRLKISVRTMTKKDGRSTFKQVKGYVILPTLDHDGNKLFEGVRKISVHFRKKAFDNAKNCKSIDDLKSGYLYVKACGLRIPPYYQVTLDNDGNEVYPSIWIDSDILGFEPKVVAQSNLNVDDYEGDTYDAETGEIIEDNDSATFDVEGVEGE